MVEKLALRRFWIKVEGDKTSRLGYGVTAWTEEDAVNILQSRAFGDRPLPQYSIVADVDVSELDAGHIRPNMESPTWRGVWFPIGLAEAKSR
jgi:hypothetical protein